MKLIIEVNTETMTLKDRMLLEFIGQVGAADEVEYTQEEKPAQEPKVEKPVVEEPKVEKPVVEEPKKPAKAKGKKETLGDLEVKLEDLPKTPEAPKAEAPIQSGSVPKDAMALNDFAKSIVKPEYAPHYVALLKEIGVAKFSQVPQDKLQMAYDKLIEIQQNVVV